MARKSQAQSPDQVALPFDDLGDPTIRGNSGNGATQPATETPPKKLRAKRSLNPPVSSPAPIANGVSEVIAAYEPAASGVVTWEILEPLASDAIIVWNDGSELEWAERMWDLFTGFGLAHYSNPLEYHQVIVRFTALCSLYLDFCRIAWGKGQELPYSSWAEDLHLSELRIGQLLGTAADWENEPGEGSLFERALQFLTRSERPWVLKMIRRHFGDSALLLEAFWATRLPYSPATTVPTRNLRLPTQISPNPALLRGGRGEAEGSGISGTDLDDEAPDPEEFSDHDFGDEPDSNMEEDEFGEEKQQVLMWLQSGCP